jgi:hypothetical protein
MSFCPRLVSVSATTGLKSFMYVLFPWSAWDLLPEPQTDWEAATWILGAIGDVNLQQGNYEAGRDNLAMAMQCPNAIGNWTLSDIKANCRYWEAVSNPPRLVDLGRRMDFVLRFPKGY